MNGGAAGQTTISAAAIERAVTIFARRIELKNSNKLIWKLQNATLEEGAGAKKSISSAGRCPVDSGVASCTLRTDASLRPVWAYSGIRRIVA